mmetsp:Transcript_31720/g.40768  ORF Transcript_31720/g.40768 Transcript_31720/m.40768 type:complete len:266 (+) Transcript_31720:1-798(+)
MKRKNGTAELAELGEEPQTKSHNSFKRLPKGVVHLNDKIGLEEQKLLFLAAIDMGSRFYLCNNEKTRAMKMMNLGLKNEGGSHDQKIPQTWKNIALRIAHEACKTEPSLSIIDPNICVVNLYCEKSKLSSHQDIVTRKDPFKPIISISLGLCADFVFQKDYGKHKQHTIKLKHGDALVFGGKSRTILHSVPRIYNDYNEEDDNISTHHIYRANQLCQDLSLVQKDKLISLLSGLTTPLFTPEKGLTESNTTLKVNFRMNFNFRER